MSSIKKYSFSSDVFFPPCRWHWSSFSPFSPCLSVLGSEQHFSGTLRLRDGRRCQRKCALPLPEILQTRLHRPCQWHIWHWPPCQHRLASYVVPLVFREQTYMSADLKKASSGVLPQKDTTVSVTHHQVAARHESSTALQSWPIFKRLHLVPKAHYPSICFQCQEINIVHLAFILQEFFFLQAYLGCFFLLWDSFHAITCFLCHYTFAFLAKLLFILWLKTSS